MRNMALGIGRVSCRIYRGFTLIELMVVVVIVGILASIAIPSYQDYIRKGRRADTQQYMLTLAQKNLQYFMDSRTYTSNVADLLATPSTVSSYYTIAITVNAGPPATFSISATPTGMQVSDKCGTLTLTSANTKSSSTGSGCW